ncbi:MAG: transporter ATP-binding protein [Symbiobacteriaceae bacterium]|jgi:ABC-2 type transport system ATP-binding protein|nr:transporter ATP-binding protein [Symbiobacteriaceae bacterium]
MIEINAVSKSYGGGTKKAVDHLSLTVKPGEIFGFLGPNGAGKTTTLKMIVGLLRPDSGSVRINGFDITTQPLEAKRQMAFVPDTPEVYEKLTGLEYLNFIGDIYNVPASQRRERIERFAETFELTGALGERISSYSHGMQQKLVLMSALLHNPPVWILDEPMVGLDPRSAHVLKELMAEHTRNGNTLFFSTHVLEVAEKLCDRVAIIKQGRIIACGTVEELRQNQSGGSLEEIFLELTQQ